MSARELTEQDEALCFEELERQQVELLPDRQEMALVNVHPHGNFNKAINPVVTVDIL